MQDEGSIHHYLHCTIVVVFQRLGSCDGPLWEEACNCGKELVDDADLTDAAAICKRSDENEKGLKMEKIIPTMVKHMCKKIHTYKKDEQVNKDRMI